MSIYIISRGERVDPKFTVFSDGAEICEINEDITKGSMVVCSFNDCSIDLIKLLLVKDVLANKGVERLGLTIPYIPNARADRRFNKNQSHSLKVFCGVINQMCFARVFVCDPHSDVSTSLLDNVRVTDQVDCFMQQKPLIDRVSDDYILCAPDLGATKKCFDLVMELGHKEYIQGVKIRDTSNGNIIKCDVICDDLDGRDVVIVDDIADGGASFIYLSEKLKAKGAGKVILYVTHGIFSKGLRNLVGKVDYIFVHNLFEKFVNIRDLQLFNYGEK